METAYCLSLTLLLVAAPLVTTTHEEEADNYDSYSESAEGDVEEVEGVVQPSASRPGPTEVRDILDDNYHMFRRKRAAGHSADNDEQGNSVPVFHNIEKKTGLQHQRSKDDLRLIYLLKTI